MMPEREAKAEVSSARKAVSPRRLAQPEVGAESLADAEVAVAVAVAARKAGAAAVAMAEYPLLADDSVN